MFKKIFAFPGYRAPAGEEDDPGSADRGDELTDEQKAAAEAEEKEAAKAALSEDEKKALPGAKGSEEGAGEGEEDTGTAKKADHRVPKSRLDEVLAKSRAREAELRAQIEALTRTSTVDATTKSVGDVEKDIADLEAKHKQALDDGKSDAATALLREIRIRERQIADLRSENLSDRARALAVEQVRVDLLISRLESEFPQINPESDEYDQDTVDEVLFLRQSFEAKGLPSSEALSRAMKYVFAAAPAKPDTAEAKKGLNADKASGDRKAAAVGKAVDAAKRTPPSGDGLGADSDKKGGAPESNVEKLTEEEFAALPESTKARMRGDFA